MAGAGGRSQAVASGAIIWDSARADLYELVPGSAEGCSCFDQITVFKNNGGAHLDLCAASALAGALGRRFTRHPEPAPKARVRSCCGRVSTSTGWPCSTITPPSMKIR